MNLGQCVDERFTSAGAGLYGQHALGDGHIAHDVAVDEIHNVKIGAVDFAVGAQCASAGHRHARVLQRRDHSIFAAHVVCTGETMTERRTSKNIMILFGVAHRKSEIRVAAGDELEFKRRRRTSDIFFEPCRNFCRVNAAADRVTHHQANYLVFVGHCHLRARLIGAVSWRYGD